MVGSRRAYLTRSIEDRSNECDLKLETVKPQHRWLPTLCPRRRAARGGMANRAWFLQAVWSGQLRVMRILEGQVRDPTATLNRKFNFYSLRARRTHSDRMLEHLGTVLMTIKKGFVWGDAGAGVSIRVFTMLFLMWRKEIRNGEGAVRVAGGELQLEVFSSSVDPSCYTTHLPGRKHLLVK